MVSGNISPLQFGGNAFLKMQCLKFTCNPIKGALN